MLSPIAEARREQRVLADPVLHPSDFLEASDLETLALLDGLDELGRFDEAAVGAGVEPGDAAP